VAHNRNVAVIKRIIEGANKCFQKDPTRWFEVNLAAFACENSISFNAFESMPDYNECLEVSESLLVTFDFSTNLHRNCRFVPLGEKLQPTLSTPVGG
jgi:hypothetical protein